MVVVEVRCLMCFVRWLLFGVCCGVFCVVCRLLSAVLLFVVCCVLLGCLLFAM